MSDELKRKKRMMRIQKTVLAKSEMDYAASLRAKHALKEQIEEINALVQGENMAVRVFPKLTYQHLSGLMDRSTQLEELNSKMRDKTIREQRKLELFGEAVASAHNDAEKSKEAKALSEISDRSVSSGDTVSATGKVEKLD